ncbi:MAG TPA: 2-oxoglutarate dehydrogenase complex dihydrolipoyllysine-residue succinyltransferase [Vicinamibacterales bacterium]|nr:2-oxoglutarate dehydrogenase complex dihydrolipoyllysine-residue succinyltransferase [Vicinamibacterales bacterium]HPK70755.1 2-oxoglutarate dehydrogenase complex dihydrolipoyllysine-residue succinyltransferase [Vicinamibacterales bacterium]
MAADIVVPEVGESVVDARVVRWLKQPGEAVAAGEAVVELETDKVDVEVAAPRAGVLGRIDHADGADVKVGDVLGVIDDSEAGAAAVPPARAEAAPPATAATPPGAARADRARATPAARRAADAHDVDLARVRGSGPGGRIMRRDVEDAAPSASASQPSRQPSAERARGERAEERIRMSKRRATIARRLVEAQHTAAMLTTFNEADMSAVMALRERHKQAFRERHGVGLGIASFFVKAAIGALREFPRLNAEIQGDEIVLKRYYDIGVAVGATEGLVVPVLRDADRLSFAEIEREIRRFAAAAEDGSLSLADLQGGTFTITNGGVFGSMLSTPILNPPQVGILGLHAIKERPVGIGGQVVLRPLMYLAMTYDHRIVDGAEAVRFLVRVKELVEDPGAMLLE